MSTKKDITDMLVAMGFQPNYVLRAFKVYEKNYGHSYNVEVISEIIIRLQNKDRHRKYSQTQKLFEKTTAKLNWKWTNYKGSNSFYICIAQEIFRRKDDETQMKIRNDIYEYILFQSKDTTDHFQKLFQKYDGSPNFYVATSRKKKTNSDAQNIDILAVSELYNVRIIVYEPNTNLDSIILSNIKSYVSNTDIPLILLTKMKPVYGELHRADWGIINDTHDITNLLPLQNTLGDYSELIKNVRENKLVVVSVCNYWTEQSKVIPFEVYDIVTRFMPSLNIRPIGVQQERHHSVNWRQQMQNRRNEIVPFLT